MRGIVLFSLIPLVIIALVLAVFLSTNVQSQLNPQIIILCNTANWSCQDWASVPCVNNIQTRTCSVSTALIGTTSSSFHAQCSANPAVTNKPPTLTQPCTSGATPIVIPQPSTSPIVLSAASAPLPPLPASATQLIGSSTIFNSICGDRRLPQNCTGFMPWGASFGLNVPIPVDVPGVIKLACQKASGDWDFQYGCNYKYSVLEYVGRVRDNLGDPRAKLLNSVTRKGSVVPGTTPPKLQTKLVVNEFGENGTVYTRVGLDLQNGCHGPLNDNNFEDYCNEHGAQLIKEDCGPIDVATVQTCSYEYFDGFRNKVGGPPDHPFKPADEDEFPQCGYYNLPRQLSHLGPEDVCSGFGLEYSVNDPSISYADRSTCNDLGIKVETRRTPGGFSPINNFLITGPSPYSQTPSSYDPVYSSATFGSVGAQGLRTGTKVKCTAKNYYDTPLTGFVCPTTNKNNNFNNPGYNNAYKGTTKFPTITTNSLTQSQGLFPIKENVKGGRYSCVWSIPVVSKIEMKVNNRNIPASLSGLQLGDSVTISGEVSEQQGDDVIVAIDDDTMSFADCNFENQSGCLAFAKITNTKTPQKFELKYTLSRSGQDAIGLVVVDQNQDEDPIIFNFDVSIPPDCMDGDINVNETEVADWVNYNTDCGGDQAYLAVSQPGLGSCPRCQDFRTCRVGSDCLSNACEASLAGQKICVSCNDNFKNQDETDIDCGGNCASNSGLFCLNGEKCLVDSDCLPTSICDNSTKTCAAKPALLAAAVPGCQATWQCASVGTCNPTTKLQNQLCVQTNIGACPNPANQPPAAQTPCQIVAASTQPPTQTQQCITCGLSSCSLNKPNGQLGYYQIADQNCQTQQLPNGCASLPAGQQKFIMGTATPCTSSSIPQPTNQTKPPTQKQEFQDWLTKFGFIPAKSTDFTLLADLKSVLLKLCNSDGCIQYLEPLDLTTLTPQQLYQAIVISRGVVVVDTETYAQLNKPVIITLNGIFLKDLAVALNGICSESYELISYNPTTGELIFKVPHLSAWTAIDQKTGCATAAVIADTGIYPPIVWALVAIAAALLIITFLTRGRSKTLYQIEQEELGGT